MNHRGFKIVGKVSEKKEGYVQATTGDIIVAACEVYLEEVKKEIERGELTVSDRETIDALKKFIVMQKDGAPCIPTSLIAGGFILQRLLKIHSAIDIAAQLECRGWATDEIGERR